MADHLFRNDGQADEPELASRLVACPACDAAPGQGCKHGDTFSNVRSEPHYGRVELLRALARYVRATIPTVKPPPVRISDDEPARPLERGR